jgi:tRNA nucleotidyltransferase (CCA-adding enzyme)
MHGIIWAVIRMKDYASLGKEVLKIFNDHGYEAFFVGGYVRDFLLAIPLSDIDIATSATPTEVAAIFEQTKDTGLKFGTVTVLYHHFAFEVTTFRTDGVYADNRHPEGVRYSKTLAEDLVRRDFTVNALAMDRFGKVYDFADGLSDLKTKTLRAIGDPNRRFHEDALRILRAFRFVAKLDFTIEPLTFESIRKNHPLLAHISIERIMGEMELILARPYAQKAFRAMADAGVTDTLADLAKGIRFLAQVQTSSLDHFQFYALCFYLNGGEIPETWRFSNKEREIIEKLVALVTVTENDPFDAVLVYAYGKDLCLQANGIKNLLVPGSDALSRILQIDADLPIRKTCDLAFKGSDILAMKDLKDARLIGEVISDLVLRVITKQLPNEYAALKAHALAKIAELEAEGAK